MQVLNPDLLLEFRQKPKCEYCGEPNRYGLDPHHTVMTRGMGGGSRIDHPLNLTALCRSCHDSHGYSAVPSRMELINVIAQREGCTAAFVIDTIERLWRQRKGGPTGSEALDLDQRPSVRRRSPEDQPRRWDDSLETWFGE